MFNFLKLLHLGGFGLGYLIVIFLGVATGCIGFYCAKKDRMGDEKYGWLFLNFLFLALCYFFSIPAFLNGEIGKGIGMTVPILILSFIFLFPLFFKDSKTALSRSKDHIGWKLLFIGLSAVAGLILTEIIIAENDTLFFLQLNQKQKAEWWISEKILKQGSCQEDIAEAIEKIKKYNYLSSPFAGIAYLKLGNISEATKNFRDYANSRHSRQGKEKHFWLGAAEYYQGKFYLAAQEFELAEKPDLILLSLFKSGNLNQQRFDELKGNFGNSGLIDIASEIEKTLLPKEIAQKLKKKKGFEELVWEKLNRLEKLISEKSGNGQTPVVSLDERINKIVFTRILAYEKAPVLSKVDTDKLFWFMVSILPVFLTMMFITNAIIRDHLSLVE